MSDLIIVPEGRNMAEVSWPAYSKIKGGTCDFMTAACAQHCKLSTNDIERNSLKYFEEHKPEQIAHKLMRDMIALDATILCWFVGSGDCPKRLTKKVLDVVETVSRLGIIQHGFTRNTEFWETANDNKACTIVLTVEKQNKAKMEKAEAIERGNYNDDEAFMVAVPDYENRIVTISRLGNTKYTYSGMGCGGGWVRRINPDFNDTPVKVTVEDCSICLKNSDGCFYLQARVDYEQ